MITFSEIQASVVDWHGLDPSKFGALKLSGRFSTARDSGSWQDNADCFLFDKVMVITVEKEPSKRTLKGSVLLKDVKGVRSVGEAPGASSLEMHLASEDIPVLKLRCEDQAQRDAWVQELSAVVYNDG